MIYVDNDNVDNRCSNKRIKRKFVRENLKLETFSKTLGSEGNTLLIFVQQTNAILEFNKWKYNKRKRRERKKCKAG